MAQIHGRAGGSLATDEARRRWGEQITFQGHEGEMSTWSRGWRRTTKPPVASCAKERAFADGGLA